MASRNVAEGDLLWEPSEAMTQAASITRYLAWLREEKGLRFAGYDELWEWSVRDLEDFWESLWDYYKIQASIRYRTVLSKRSMPAASWFEGAHLNYTEHVFRHRSPQRPALRFQSETQPLTEMSWDDLYDQVSSVASALRNMGVRPGDRVVAYMPNIPQTLVAFLACASLGATWSSCSPDFGIKSVTDRFRQIEPKVLFAVDGYQYGGKQFDCRPVIERIRESLPTLQRTVLVPYLWPDEKTDTMERTQCWSDLLKERDALVYEQVPFGHPLWVVYSSGTTGLPKPLVHGQGGILLELLKFLDLHVNVQPGEVFFWFSTTGWVMWNVMQASLLTGATAVLYDGSPGYPNMDVLWDMAEKSGMTVFGTSAAYLTACMNDGMKPGRVHDLSALQCVGSTGSPLSPAGFKWVYDNVKQDILLGSVSGGTDPCTAFLGCCPLLPVRAGELQCRCLGVKAEAFDENGTALTDQVGELVITQPMPSMPLYLWNDHDNRRYTESYFQIYPGAWRHGDWVKITSRGSAVIVGRSDSTLKRMGVRMGSSEIYGVVEEMPEVRESLIIGYDGPDGNYRMPLFVVLKEGHELDNDLKAKIKKTIRTALSPRHVPDEIFAIPAVPKTLNAKRLEVPVKKILSGVPPEQAVNVDSMSNPGSLEFFKRMAEQMYGKGRE